MSTSAVKCKRCGNEVTQLFGYDNPESERKVMGTFCKKCGVLDREANTAMAGGQLSPIRRYIDGVLQADTGEQDRDGDHKAIEESAVPQTGDGPDAPSA